MATATRSALRSGAVIGESTKSAKTAQRAAKVAASAIFSSGSPSTAAASLAALNARGDVQGLKRKLEMQEAPGADKELAQQYLAERAQHHTQHALSLLSQLAARMGNKQLDDLFAPLTAPKGGDIVRVYEGSGSQFQYGVFLGGGRAKVYAKGSAWQKLRFCSEAAEEVVAAAALGQAGVTGEVQLLLGKVQASALCRSPHTVCVGGSVCVRKVFCGSVPHYAYRKARKHARVHGAGAATPQEQQRQRQHYKGARLIAISEFIVENLRAVTNVARTCGVRLWRTRSTVVGTHDLRQLSSR